jgi:hypothetical protein
MTHSILINGKGLGERFPLARNFDLTVVGLSHGDEEPLQLVKLGSYTFAARAILHTGGCENRLVDLTFRFHNKVNAPLTFEDAEWEYRLSVAFLTFVKEEVLLDFRLDSEERVPLHTTALSSHRYKGKKVRATHPLQVFILGVWHDETERKVRARLPRIMAQAWEDEGGPGRVVTFWEDAFNRQRHFLRPHNLFVASCYNMPLESVLQSSLEFLFAALILYLMRGVDDEICRIVWGHHGEDLREAEAQEALYGKDGSATDFVLLVMDTFLKVAMLLGREGSYEAFASVFVDRARTDTFLSHMADLYENVVLGEEARGLLRMAKQEWYSGGEEGEEEEEELWYFTPFFGNITNNFLKQHWDAVNITKNRKEFRVLLMEMVQVFVRGKDNAQDVERLLDPHRPVLPKRLSSEQLEGLMESIAEEEETLGPQVNERYFSGLNRLIYEEFGQMGGALFSELVLSVRGREHLLQMSEVVTLYRDMQSFIHVQHVMRTVKEDRCVLVVGSDHVSRLKKLFRASGARVTTYHRNTGPGSSPSPFPSTVRHNTLFRAYLALEAIDHWMSRDVLLSPEAPPVPVPRLQLYLFLEYTTRPTDATLLYLLFYRFVSVSPFHSPLTLYPYPSSQTAEVEDVRAHYRGLGYPVPLTEILVQCRALPTGEETEREPGEWFSDHFTTLFRRLEPEIDPASLPEEWPTGMAQAVPGKCSKSFIT